jgi:hypothetical protein
MTTTKRFTAQDIYDNMTVGKRTATDDTYYYFKDTAPKQMRDRWRELTGNYDDYNFTDLDEYYDVLYTLVSIMIGYENFTEDELYEIDWRDTYNSDRLMWINDNLARADYYLDVKDNGAEHLFDILGDMQDLSRGQLANYIFNNFLEV